MDIVVLAEKFGSYSVGRNSFAWSYNWPNGTIGRMEQLAEKNIITSKKELKLFLNYHKYQ
jgi:hypothetical protein